MHCQTVAMDPIAPVLRSQQASQASLSDLASWLAAVSPQDAALRSRSPASPPLAPPLPAHAPQPPPLQPAHVHAPPLPLRAQGNAAFSRGDFDSAAALYSAAAASAATAGDARGEALALSNRAQARLSLRQWAAAAADASDALQLDAGSAKTWMRRAAALNPLARHAAALADLRVAAALAGGGAAPALLEQVEVEMERTRGCIADAAMRSLPVPLEVVGVEEGVASEAAEARGEVVSALLREAMAPGEALPLGEPVQLRVAMPLGEAMAMLGEAMLLGEMERATAGIAAAQPREKPTSAAAVASSSALARLMHGVSPPLGAPQRSTAPSPTDTAPTASSSSTPRKAGDFERRWRVASADGRTQLLLGCTGSLRLLFVSGMEPELLGGVLTALRRMLSDDAEDRARAAADILRQVVALRGHALAATLLDDEGAEALQWLCAHLGIGDGL